MASVEIQDLTYFYFILGTDPSDYSTLDLVRALATAGVVGSVVVAVLGLWIYRRNQTCNLKTANV